MSRVSTTVKTRKKLYLPLFESCNDKYWEENGMGREVKRRERREWKGNEIQEIAYKKKILAFSIFPNSYRKPCLNSGNKTPQLHNQVGFCHLMDHQIIFQHDDNGISSNIFPVF